MNARVLEAEVFAEAPEIARLFDEAKIVFLTS